jgi:hypothetical protein
VTCPTGIIQGVGEGKMDPPPQAALLQGCSALQAIEAAARAKRRALNC